MTSRKTAAKEKRLLVTSRFLNYFFVLRQNKNSQKILNFQDFPAVLSKSTGIPKAKPHDNNREMQFCANENDQISIRSFHFYFRLQRFNANTTNGQFGNFEKVLLDTNKLNVHFGIAEFCN